MKGNHISTLKAEQIKNLFSSDMSIKKMSKEIGCNDRTIRAEFIRQFGKEKTDERSLKIWQLKAGAVDHRYSIQTHRPDTWIDIIGHFSSDLPLKEIGMLCNVSLATVANVWRKHFGILEYEHRVIKMMRIQKEKADKSLQQACFVGSKNEILCYELLVKALLNIEVKHHDYQIVPRLELDITIPEFKTVIAWDGVCHRKPIFGKKTFQRTNINDKRKEKILLEKGWRHISVIDEGSHNPVFVAKIVNEIVALLSTSWEGKKELR